MNMNRRGILLGLASALAAPAIVHAGNLMPVKAWKNQALEDEAAFIYRYGWTEVNLGYAITRESLREALYAGTFANFPGFPITK